ncbi:MAG: GNAT family N-acetyltransferase [Bacteroidota bacterium]
MKKYRIINTEISDLPFIYSMFDDAIVYQRRNNFPVWENYDKDILNVDIGEKRQFKLVDPAGEIACIFTICFDDKITWRERDQGNAVYLHRIVVNKKFKGQRLVGQILEWSVNYVKEKNIPFVRMDTWADNPTIIAYYQSFGFAIVEYFTNPDTDELPVQARGNRVVLLEYKV